MTLYERLKKKNRENHEILYIVRAGSKNNNFKIPELSPVHWYSVIIQ